MEMLQTPSSTLREVEKQLPISTVVLKINSINFGKIYV